MESYFGKEMKQNYGNTRDYCLLQMEKQMMWDYAGSDRWGRKKRERQIKAKDLVNVIFDFEKI